MKVIVFFASLLVAGATSAACVEGSKGYVSKYNDERGRYEQVSRNCVNGTYMTAEEKASYIYNPRVTCVEGTKGWVTLHDADGRSYQEARTCVNGTYMTAAESATYVRAPKASCQEGTYGSARAGNHFPGLDESEAKQPITVICKNKKWVPVRTR